MPTSLSRASNTKVGTCPHGLPLGACPICNGMGGGGSVKKDNKPKEMSWNECYAIGQMLKAQKQARQNTAKMYAAQDLNAYLNRLQEQINALKTMAANNLSKPVSKIVNFVANNVLMPTVRVIQAFANGIKNLAANIQKNVDNIKQKLADISDKLASIFGEAKAAIEKKLSEKFKDLKKKAFNLFGIFSAENEEDEELKKIEEEKRLFELNTAKEAVFEKNNQEELAESEEK